MKPPPRYARLAAALRAAIARGEYPVGAQLPTEQALCAEHRVSRHTAREALRLLREDGLIARRPGAGTTVTRPIAEPALIQPLDGVDDLLQYARDARLQVLDIGPLAPGAPLRAPLELGAASAMTLITGLRVVDTRPPVALARIVVRADLAPRRADLQRLNGAVTQWLETTHGLAFDTVEQDISAETLTGDDARALSAEPGAAALRTRRRFRLSSGEVALASDTIHPGDRFVYAMKLRRAAARS